MAQVNHTWISTLKIQLRKNLGILFIPTIYPETNSWIYAVSAIADHLTFENPRSASDREMNSVISIKRSIPISIKVAFTPAISWHDFE